MGFTPKLVALDIDGTLIDYRYGLLPEIKAAVRSVVDAGIPVVLATGRSWDATWPIAEQLELPAGWSVCSNGAILLTSPPTKIEHEVSFDPAACIETVARVRPAARMCVERGLDRFATQLFPEGELTGHIELVSLEELASQPVSRLIVREPEAEDQQRFFDELAAGLGMHSVAYFAGWTTWLDIAPEGIDKAAGLTRVCTELGVEPADVLAIGDGNNDIEMLSWAGRGVAMGDAPEQVKAAADTVTATFEELGVARELRRWFPPN